MANKDQYITISANEWQNLVSMVMEIREKVAILADDAAQELLSPTETCKWLKIGRSTYQRLVDDKVFEQVRIGQKSGGRVYVKRSDIERLIEQGKL